MAQFTFKNLTQEVRHEMLNELISDIEDKKTYLSNRLTEAGKEIFVDALKNSIQSGDELTFEEAIANYFEPNEVVQGKSKKVPANAAQLLSQGEFNRYYIRGICLVALQKKLEEVEIYRARESSWSRPESEAKIGSKLNATLLLEDIRNNIGKQPEYLPEVNSGLSVFI